MDAIEFVNRYPTYLAHLGKVVKPEYQPVIGKMKKIDPHDVVKYEHYFHSEAEAVGKKGNSRSTDRLRPLRTCFLPTAYSLGHKFLVILVKNFLYLSTYPVAEGLIL